MSTLDPHHLTELNIHSTPARDARYSGIRVNNNGN